MFSGLGFVFISSTIPLIFDSQSNLKLFISTFCLLLSFSSLLKQYNSSMHKALLQLPFALKAISAMMSLLTVNFSMSSTCPHIPIISSSVNPLTRTKRLLLRIGSINFDISRHTIMILKWLLYISIVLRSAACASLLRSSALSMIIILIDFFFCTKHAQNWPGLGHILDYTLNHMSISVIVVRRTNFNHFI